MLIHIPGSGSAFTIKNYNSHFLIKTKSHKYLAIDFGGDSKMAINNMNLNVFDISGIVLTHLHGDHCLGLEYLGFLTYFSNKPRPFLMYSQEGLKHIWDMLKHSMKYLSTHTAELETFFDISLNNNDNIFYIDDIKIELFKSSHVTNFESYSVLITQNGVKLYITGDINTTEQNTHLYEISDIIFHDTETLENAKSGVHTHFTDLIKLDEKIKEKMYLYHYNDNVLIESEKWEELVKIHKFKGFLKKGQTLII